MDKSALMRKWTSVFLFAFILIHAGVGNASNWEDLKNKLPGSTGKQRYKILVELSEMYFETDSVYLAKDYLEEAISIAQKEHITDRLSEVYRSLGYIRYNNGDYAQGLTLSKLAIQLGKEENDPKMIVESMMLSVICYMKGSSLDSARFMLDEAGLLVEKYDLASVKPVILNNLASIEYKLGNKDEAISTYLKLVDTYQRLGQENSLSVVYNNIGEVSRSAGNFEAAKDYFFSALGLCEKYGDHKGLLMVYSNLANSYLEEDSMGVSEKWFEKAHLLAEEINDTFQLAIINHNLGKLHARKNHFKIARQYLDESVKLCLKFNYRLGLMRNKVMYGEILYKEGNYPQAILVLEEALQKADSLHIPEEKIHIYDLLQQSYSKAENYSIALEMIEQMYHIKDSLLLDKKNQNIIYLQSKYEKEKTKKQIAELQSSILTKENRIRYYIIAFLMIFLVLSVVVFVLILKRRKAQLENERTRLENDILKVDIEYKNKELTSNALYLANAYEQSLALIKRLDELYPYANDAMKELLGNLQQEISSGVPAQAWKDFESRFEQVHVGFFQNLTNRFPGLTPNEVRICSLLRLNLNTKEIAVLMNRTTGTIDNARSTIRKKMRLEEDNNLTTLLMSL